MGPTNYMGVGMSVGMGMGIDKDDIKKTIYTN
jgi:hypothetical protein